MNDPTTNATYEGDFYGWLLKSAELLRQGQFSELDLEQLADALIDEGEGGELTIGAIFSLQPRLRTRYL